MVKEVVNFNEFQDIISTSLVIVDFYADWCPPCRMIAPKFADMATRLGNKDVVFLKVNVDKARDIASYCGISAMPTFKAYSKGRQVGEVVGASQQALEGMIKYHADQKYR